jgi:hypothetical protein
MTEKEENKQVRIISSESKKVIAVPPQGSLGLLALGYRGIVAWREARNKAIAEEKGGKQ